MCVRNQAPYCKCSGSTVKTQLHSIFPFSLLYSFKVFVQRKLLMCEEMQNTFELMFITDGVMNNMMKSLGVSRRMLQRTAFVF